MNEWISNEWISVNDRLPQLQDPVQLMDCNGKCCIGFRSMWERLYRVVLDGKIIDSISNVTHWMHLPSLPNT